MNVLILAAGEQPPNSHEDSFPLCLTEFNGVPLIEAIAQRIEPLAPKNVIVALRERDLQEGHLNSVVSLLFQNGKISTTRGATQGAACTALLATEHINNEEELLIISANELVDADIGAIVSDFRSRALDAGTVTFPSIHPRYSYVRSNENGYVVEAAQKNPISREATVGMFWFARGRDFVNAAKNMIRKGASTADKYFICPTFNEMILQQAKIGTYKIDAKLYHPLKSARQISAFENLSEMQAWGAR